MTKNVKRWRSGYSDGSGPEYVTDGENSVVKTIWGCSCCQGEPDETHIALANQIAREHNAHDLMVAAVKKCLDAERKRSKKLLPGAPANTYTKARIKQLEAALDVAEGRVV